MSHRVRFTRGAEADLLELYDFLARTDLQAAEGALAALRKAMGVLESFPFACRKAAGKRQSPFLREMIVSFGRSGYVVLYEIEDARIVTVLAVRHQREDDYH